MRRFIPAAMIAAFALTTAGVPAATAAPAGTTLSHQQTEELVVTYEHLINDFYQKVDRQSVLNGAHDGLVAYLKAEHLTPALPALHASGDDAEAREPFDPRALRHPARFVLIGSGNPEEGDLRPQLLDRFGLSVEVRTPDTLAERIEVVRRRDAFERDPKGFAERWAEAQSRLRDSVVAARASLADIAVSDAALERAATLCMELGTDGVRGELTLIRAARALAALQGDAGVADAHLRLVAPLALRHRLRRNPLDETVATVRVERAVADLFGA